MVGWEDFGQRRCGGRGQGIEEARGLGSGDTKQEREAEGGAVGNAEVGIAAPVSGRCDHGWAEVMFVLRRLRLLLTQLVRTEAPIKR